ncbi:OpgC domain-containing protein [Curtobacterium sp. MCBA15_012]|uniref:OpgC domain-containing protein n=1 Tax=Curtobacterium sp. MCBA15_012 TaxID=1898738 RepID=UPI0009F6CCC4|nr:OpgC domain-containing protein [Curtobacterium sp. MCBA15_012]WIB00867.1 OpgC domain-containing protein [Curtobacterium sp. MCBA15_012]
MRGVLAKAVALLVVSGTLLLGVGVPATAATAASATAATSSPDTTSSPAPTSSTAPTSGATAPGTATSASRTGAGLLPADGRAWYGPDLDWGADAPDGYAGRLGATPSMYGVELDYPFDRTAREQYDRASRAAAAQGAVLVVTLTPTQSLASLTRDDARAAEKLFAQSHEQYDTQVLVRFAPQMNGTWVRWGQQPTAYVSAFRTLAGVVHRGDSDAAMVWSPSYGAGYPFGESAGRLEDLSAVDVAKADTNGDGKLDAADDPYGPYWPGAGSVDWVGLSMFFFGKGKSTEAAGRDVPLTTNEEPTAGEVEARFDETWGYQQPQTEGTFTERFATGEDRPMLLDTGALYDHSLKGASQLEVKQAWWRQVFAAVQDRPDVRGVTFLETNRREPEAGNRVADWRDTAVPAVAGSFRTDLQATDRFEGGPVTDRVTPQDGAAAISQEYETGGDQMAWIVWLSAGLAAVFLLSGLVGRLLPSWRYPDDGKPGRDLRLDLFRGFIILAVVITHIEIGGPYSYITLHATGAITGAEMFVFLSGMVLGMTYPFAIKKFGEWVAAVGAWKRARKQYLVTLGVILVVFAMSFVPFLNTDAITTFTDRGTGTGGVGAEGRVYDLYPNAMQLLAYPPPWFAIKQFLLLEMGPWPFNIMGLFVVLSLFIPVFMWVIRRGFWWALLLVSWGVYVFQALNPEFRPLNSQFEAVFPLLTWQVVFTHGLVLGYYRRQVIGALTGRLGKVLIGVGITGYALFLVYVWAGNQFGFTPAPFPATMYDQLYNTAYQRVDLQWGRLVDIAFFAIVSYAILTVFWKPIAAVIGWLWIPIGQASLYVFVWQVFFALAIASIPGVDWFNGWIGFAAHTVLILLVWYMIRKKFLFSIIPR